MNYKRRSEPKYVPLFRYVREAPLPAKAKQFLDGAKYIMKAICPICGEESLQVYRFYLGSDMRMFKQYKVCVNPECEAYGTVAIA